MLRKRGCLPILILSSRILPKNGCGGVDTKRNKEETRRGRTKRRRVVEEQVEVLTNMPEPRNLELGAAVRAGCSALPELLGAAELLGQQYG